jgi:hypothetical protein
MPHSQARNGIKFTKGLQLLNTLMSARRDISATAATLDVATTK